MLAFAMLAAIRRQANMPAPPKISLTMLLKSRRLSAGQFKISDV